MLFVFVVLVALRVWVVKKSGWIRWLGKKKDEKREREKEREKNRRREKTASRMSICADLSQEL